MTFNPLPPRALSPRRPAVVTAGLLSVILAGGCADARHGNHSTTKSAVASGNAAAGGFDVSTLRVRPVTSFTGSGDSGDVSLTSQNSTDASAPPPPSPANDPQAYVTAKA